jgi:hypothetical protein
MFDNSQIMAAAGELQRRALADAQALMALRDQLGAYDASVNQRIADFGRQLYDEQMAVAGKYLAAVQGVNADYMSAIPALGGEIQAAMARAVADYQNQIVAYGALIQQAQTQQAIAYLTQMRDLINAELTNAIALQGQMFGAYGAPAPGGAPPPNAPPPQGGPEQGAPPPNAPPPEAQPGQGTVMPSPTSLPPQTPPVSPVIPPVATGTSRPQH